MSKLIFVGFSEDTSCVAARFTNSMVIAVNCKNVAYLYPPSGLTFHKSCCYTTIRFC